MLPNFNDSCVLAGTQDFEGMSMLQAKRPFSQDVCEFLHELSQMLLKDSKAKKFPDIISFGYFCRKANIAAVKNSYEQLLDFCLGRGVTFHIAPSNVPINFAYSLVCALLAGNSSIVRVSSKEFEQVTVICRIIQQLLLTDDFKHLNEYISILRYSHDMEITQFFSSLCDVRIIWGGDATINQIRTANLSARAFDITFADRYSLAVIDAQTYLESQQKKQLALAFFNDTYLFDQNACSSPRLIYWIGGKEVLSQARDVFWNELHGVLQRKGYQIQEAIAVEKYMTECRVAIDLQGVKILKQPDTLISRMELSVLSDQLPGYACAGGSFFEYCTESLENLWPIVTRKFQTITYIHPAPGEIMNGLLEHGVSGIDRVVPFGQATNFGFVWDGYDLIVQLSRRVVVSK